MGIKEDFSFGKAGKVLRGGQEGFEGFIVCGGIVCGGKTIVEGINGLLCSRLN